MGRHRGWAWMWASPRTSGSIKAAGPTTSRRGGMWSTGPRSIKDSRRRPRNSLARLFLDAHVGVAVLVIADGHLPRLAAHLAVLDVLLDGTAARIEGDFVLLPAVRARHRNHGVGAAVARVEVFWFVVEIVDHESPLTATAARAACSHGTAPRILSRGRLLLGRSRASASPRARARAGSESRLYSATPRRRS